jgi:hypothetical protein
MQSQERDRIAAFLEGAVSTGASSQEVAALVATTLRGLDQALAPIVGQRGMAALYKRSVHLSRPTHPWLPVAEEGAESKMDVAALSAALAKRSSAEAADAGTELLASFRALLTTLIGESLTERLLRPVWANLLSGTSARDTKS